MGPKCFCPILILRRSLSTSCTTWASAAPPLTSQVHLEMSRSAYVCVWVAGWGGGGGGGGKHFPASFGGVMVSVYRNKHFSFTIGDVKVWVGGLGGGGGSKHFLTTFGIYVKVSVCMWMRATLRAKLQALVYDILPSTTAYLRHRVQKTVS